MEYATLNNGVKMPMVGYGTYQTPARITEKCVAEALRAGYRSIDMAQCYGNEREVGMACRKSGIPREELFKHESWSPLACGQNNIWNNPVLEGIAKSHDRSVSQIALRFLVQQGIIVIPKTTNFEHMKENISVLDFDLEAEEMQAIKELEVGRSLFGWW